MCISDGSSGVCSSVLKAGERMAGGRRLRQALFNLLSNAPKFTREGGVVTLSARRAEGEMLLEVADTGIGIPETDRDRVFGKFERGSLEMRHSGAGLGLSLVKSLIETGGASWRESGGRYV